VRLLSPYQLVSFQISGSLFAVWAGIQGSDIVKPLLQIGTIIVLPGRLHTPFAQCKMDGD
jgi:hypothetical protein